MGSDLCSGLGGTCSCKENVGSSAWLVAADVAVVGVVGVIVVCTRAVCCGVDDVCGGCSSVSIVVANSSVLKVCLDVPMGSFEGLFWVTRIITLTVFMTVPRLD